MEHGLNTDEEGGKDGARQEVLRTVYIIREGERPRGFPSFGIRGDPGEVRVSRGRSPSRFPRWKSTRLNSSHPSISYAVFCLKKKKRRKPAFSMSRLARSRLRTSSCTIMP